MGLVFLYFVIYSIKSSYICCIYKTAAPVRVLLNTVIVDVYILFTYIFINRYLL